MLGIQVALRKSKHVQRRLRMEGRAPSQCGTHRHRGAEGVHSTGNSVKTPRSAVPVSQVSCPLPPRPPPKLPVTSLLETKTCGHCLEFHPLPESSSPPTPQKGVRSAHSIRTSPSSSPIPWPLAPPVLSCEDKPNVPAARCPQCRVA